MRSVLAVATSFVLLESACLAGCVHAPVDRPLATTDAPYDQAPVPITRVDPIYPEFAREAKITGMVVVHVLVGRSGRVEEVKLIKGITGLNEASVFAAKQWIFKPATMANVPVPAWYEIPFEFYP
jgi:TonB family protein